MDAKLALAELLLGSTDLQASARHVTDWLAANAGIRQAAVVVEEPDSGPTLLAEHGIASGPLSELASALQDPAHPLARAMRASSPTRLELHPLAVQAPTGSGRLTSVREEPDRGAEALCAIPLRGEEEAASVGVLLVSAEPVATLPESIWVARLLGKQATRLLSGGSLNEIRFSQERMLLYSIINAVTDPILLTDTEGKLIIANMHAEKLFAAPDEASEGWRRAVALNNMLFSAALSTNAVAETALARRELLLVDPLEGSDLLFELLSSRAKDERQGTCVVSILRNVTDLAYAREEIEESYRTLRLAQAEVRDERHRLNLIIDSVADPILVTDQEGDIVLMNEPAERLFSIPRGASDALQRRVGANGANLTSFVSNVLTESGEQRYRGEIQLSDPTTGRALPVEGVAGTILSEQGELMWVVTILHDLTEAIEKARLYEQLKEGAEELERKVSEATAELAQQNELLRRQHIALEQASALKSQFLANISHEFRTPLNAILGYTHMLLNGVSGAISEPQRKSLSRIDSNSRHLLALISDILDLTRIEAGRMPLNLTTFRVADLILEVMSELEPIIRRSNLVVKARASATLPAIKSDRQKVKQIVLNLLSNALKFTPSGTVTIGASYDGEKRMVAIAVRDTGVGIPVADHAKVFEDFRQLDSSPTRGYGGTGLGLSICRRLSQMLGGTIELTSSSGKGSTFTLRLPARARRR
jgi:signal transduction histidine kinase